MLLDTWAWVEMFERSPAGARIRGRLKGAGVYASVLSLAEIAFWCERNGKRPKAYTGAVKKAAAILDATPQACETAGRNLLKMRKLSPGIGMIDAIIYAQAVTNGIELVTGDAHLKPLPGVAFIGKEK